MLIVDPATANAHRRYPSVSLLVPLAGAAPWPDRLRKLHRDAERRLRAEFGRDVDHALLARLAATVADAAVPAGARSLAVYANADVCGVVGLHDDVRERAVIDDTFATRDLVAAELRQPRYWILALHLDAPRLLHARGGRFHDRPLELTDSAAHPSSTRARKGRDRSGLRDAVRVRRLRAIDMAVAAPLADNADPLVVVAAEPTLSRFLERTRHAARIDGVVRRAPDSDHRVLAQVVAPAVAEMLTERRLAALHALDQAVGQGRAATGIERVWCAVHRGPGLLLVERDFEQPARTTANGEIEPLEDPTQPGVIDDVVDEIIEAVLARRGRVELVPPGLLARHERIAFVTWHAKGKQ